jgi:hypothetical protein
MNSVLMNSNRWMVNFQSLGINVDVENIGLLQNYTKDGEGLACKRRLIYSLVLRSILVTLILCYINRIHGIDFY